jgi:transcriptional regulator with XRE-family HTH domain
VTDPAFSTWLEDRMREAGIGFAADLARALAVDAEAVRSWRKGWHRPSAESCRELAAYFGRPLFEVLALAGYSSPERGREPTATPGFADWLDGQMWARGLSPHALARAVDVSPPTVSKWRSGRSVPDVANCQKLADFLSRPIAEVLAVAGHPAMGKG